MIEIRVLAIIGLLVTMGLVTIVMVGVFALGRWLAQRWSPDTRPRGEIVRLRPTPSSADAERRLRTRQAAWRLRC